MRYWYVFLVVPSALFALAVSCIDQPDDPRDEGEIAVTTASGGRWLAETRARIDAERYRFKPGDAAFAGSNPAQRFSVDLDSGGVVLYINKHGIDHDWVWTTVGIGRGEFIVDAAPIQPTEGDCDVPPVYGFHDACLATFEYDRGTYVEWYANRSGGLEQGFEIFEKAPGRGLLVIEGSISTPLAGRLDDEMSEILFSDQDGDVLRYGGLAAWDALGVPLDAWMEWIDPDTIRLFVDDRHAAYPITVDPGLSSAPDWTAESDQLNAWFGFSVSGAGDVNNDGYDDVIVGARLYDNGENNEGAAYVFLGQAAGVQSSPIWSAEGNQDGATFGYSVSSAGDVNADGYDDIIVGMPGYENGQNNEGKAFVFLGEAAGVQSSPIWAVESNEVTAYFGISVAGAGDVNADGYDDVIVGAPYYANGQNFEGRAYVFLGEAAGVQSSPVWTAEGNQQYAHFADDVSGAGDVNGDGYDDVIVGHPDYGNGEGFEGRAALYLGQAAGVQSSPVWTAEANQASAQFGYSVSGAGDVNADGYDDVIVGVPGHDNGQAYEGGAFLFLGQNTGLQSSPVWTAESNQAGGLFGYSVSGAGDVDADGYDDVVVGSSDYSNGQNEEGRAYVFLGQNTGLQSSPVWTAESDQASAHFGRSVSRSRRRQWGRP
ncbi:MAG: integrin alpha [Deltaproteobacteria bacterium]|nr:integrin alpha [Deltaproteobacteria bacterium]